MINRLGSWKPYLQQVKYFRKSSAFLKIGEKTKDILELVSRAARQMIRHWPAFTGMSLHVIRHRRSNRSCQTILQLYLKSAAVNFFMIFRLKFLQVVIFSWLHRSYLSWAQGHWSSYGNGVLTRLAKITENDRRPIYNPLFWLIADYSCLSPVMENSPNIVLNSGLQCHLLCDNFFLASLTVSLTIREFLSRIVSE